MSVRDEITRLETAKSDIETAIEKCGVNVPDTEKISAYASYIRQIPSAIFSELNAGPFGGDDVFIKTIKQVDGVIEATTGGLVSSSLSGLVPKIGTTTSTTISTQADEWVLTSTKGEAPTWRKLPVNAFKNDDNNTTYTFASGDGGFTVTPYGGTAQTVSIGKPATAGTADKLAYETASTNSFRHVWFSYDGEDGRLVYDNDFTYNPATNVLNVGSITGSAGSVAWEHITDKPDSFTPSTHNHTTEQIISLANYQKAASVYNLSTSDTLNSALGKLEYTARYAYDWVIGVTATDTDEYINKWSEIVGFLDSVKEGTDILDEFVTRKTTQTITGTKTFNTNLKAHDGIDLLGVTDYTNLPDTNFKFGQTKGLIHFRTKTPSNYHGNAITWAYDNSAVAQAGIYVTSGGSYGSEMWFATTNLFNDGPKAALHINNVGDISAVRGKFKGTFVTTNGTASQFVKGDGSLDSTIYATSASLGNYLPLAGGVMSGYISWQSDVNGSDISDWNGEKTKFGLRIISSPGTSTGVPAEYATALQVRGRYGFQIASQGGAVDKFYIRNISGTDRNWMELIHTGNIASYIGNGTVIINQAGSNKGSFTLNQSTAATINLTDTNYYPTAFSWTNGTTEGPTGLLTGNGMDDVSFPAIPSASSLVAGIVTTAAQTFAGEKTFAAVRLRGASNSNYGGYLYFGDGSYSYITEPTDDNLLIYSRLNVSINTSSSSTGVICDGMYLKSAVYHIGTVRRLPDGVQTEIKQGGGIDGVTINTGVSGRGGKCVIQVTNNSGFTIVLHTPNVSAWFGDYGVGSVGKHGFAYIDCDSGVFFPLEIPNGSTKKFNVIYGYVNGSQTISNDNGGFLCSLFASRRL